jgi:hypothetical protein
MLSGNDDTPHAVLIGGVLPVDRGVKEVWVDGQAQADRVLRLADGGRVRAVRELLGHGPHGPLQGSGFRVFLVSSMLD